MVQVLEVLAAEEGRHGEGEAHLHLLADGVEVARGPLGALGGALHDLLLHLVRVDDVVDVFAHLGEVAGPPGDGLLEHAVGALGVGLVRRVGHEHGPGDAEDAADVVLHGLVEAADVAAPGPLRDGDDLGALGERDEVGEGVVLVVGDALVLVKGAEELLLLLELLELGAVAVELGGVLALLHVRVRVKVVVNALAVGPRGSGRGSRCRAGGAAGGPPSRRRPP